MALQLPQFMERCMKEHPVLSPNEERQIFAERDRYGRRMKNASLPKYAAEITKRFCDYLNRNNGHGSLSRTRDYGRKITAFLASPDSGVIHNGHLKEFTRLLRERKEDIHSYIEGYSGYCRTIRKIQAHNLRLVIGQTFKLLSANDPRREDIFSAGLTELGIDAEKYISSMGRKFSTYAVPCIRGIMIRALKNDRIVHVPLSILDELKTIKDFESEYLDAHGVKPDNDTTFASLDVSDHCRDAFLTQASFCLSLDSPVYSEADTTLHDSLADNSSIDNISQRSCLHSYLE